MVNQRQLNGGEQGAGSGLNADKVDSLEDGDFDANTFQGNKPDDLLGMSTSERQAFNDLVAQMGRNDFADNLSEMAYDGGLYDIYRDQSKIASSTDVGIKTLDDGHNKGVISLNIEGDVQEFDGFEDGNYTNNPTWELEYGSETNVNSNQVKNGSFSVEMVDDGQNLYHDRGTLDGINDGDTYQAWFYYTGSFTDNHYGLGNNKSAAGANDGVSVEIASDGTCRLLTWNGSGSFITYGSLGTVNTGEWYKIKITFNPSTSSADAEILDSAGNTVGSVTGQNTSGASNLQYVNIEANLDTGDSFYWDDVSFGTNLQKTQFVQGSITSVSKDLANDGFNNPPSNAVVSQRVINLAADNDITYTLRDGNGNTKTVNQADIDTELDVSNFTSTQVEVDVNLSRDSTSATNPKSDDYMIHFKE